METISEDGSLDKKVDNFLKTYPFLLKGDLLTPYGVIRIAVFNKNKISKEFYKKIIFRNYSIYGDDDELKPYIEKEIDELWKHLPKNYPKIEAEDNNILKVNI